MVGNVIGGRTPTVVMVMDVLMLMTIFQMRRWLFDGHITFVGVGIVVLGFIFLTLICFNLGTIRNPTAAGYLFLVIMAGALFELKGILFSTIASSLVLLALILAENAGILPTPDYSVNVTQWITYTGLLAFTGGLTFYNQNNLRRALVRAKQEIEERQRTETDLRKLTQVVEQSPVSIVITDLKGNIEYVNPHFAQVTGYSLAETLGENPRILNTAMTPAETHRLLWETLLAGKEWQGEFVNRKKNGTLYTEAATILPITDLNGLPTHYLAVKEDITERKKTELALNESEKRFRTIIERAPVAVAIASRNGKLMYVNPMYVRMYGFKHADELVGHYAYELVAPRFRSDSIERWQNLEKSLQDNASYELVGIQKDGTEFPVLVAVTDAVLAEGPAIIGFFHDITARKQAEVEIRNLNARLEQRVKERTAELAAANKLLEEKVAELETSQSKLEDLYTMYRIVADNTFAWEYWFGVDGKLLYSSPSCKRITGLESEDIIREPALLEQTIHPDDLPAWRQHREEESVQKRPGQIEFRIRRVDGSTNWINHICQPVYSDQGKFLGNRCSNRDITEHKLAEEALQREIKHSQTLARIASSLNTSLELQSLLDTACEEIARLLEAPIIMIWLLDMETNMFQPRAEFGMSPEILEQVLPTLNQINPMREEKYKNIYYVEDIQKEQHNPNIPLAQKIDVHTTLNCWVYYESKTIGLISILRHELGWSYNYSDFTTLYTLSNQIAITIHNAQLYEQVKSGRQRLAAMSEKLIEVQEAERRSLALELHDQLGQMLSSTKISLDMIPSLPPAAAGDQLQRASDLVGDLIAQVRRMALDLRPSMLDDMGLFPTLRWFFRNYQIQTGELVSFDHSGLEQRFQPQVEITAYRIVQEALTNVIRHAGNKQVVVRVWVDLISLNLQIRDFGVGFDPQISLNKNESNGLSGMRERARLLGGELIIESSPGAGTSLTARLPLAINREKP
jgi:PAS domain S-box-containing protein